MRFIILMICCASFLAMVSPGHAGVRRVSAPKIVNTSQIPRATQAMRIGHRMFLVSSKNSSYAQAKIAQYCGKKKKTLLAKK